MRSFEIREWYLVAPGRAMAGVDLVTQIESLSDINGVVELKRGDRARVFKVVAVEPPLPNHMAPYRIGERIGLMVEFEGNENGPGA